MNIEEITIDQLKVGDTLCYHKRGILAAMIRIVTSSKFTHTSIVSYIGKNAVIVHEAVPVGYVPHKLDYSLKDTIQVIVKRPKVNFDVQDLHACIMDMQGAKYEFEGLVAELWWHLKNRKVWIGDKEVRKNVFCSKANAYIFRYAFEMKDYEQWWSVSPDIIAEDFRNFETYKLKIREN